MAATYLCSGCHVFVCWLLPTDTGLLIVIAVFTMDLHLELPSTHTNVDTIIAAFQYTSAEPGLGAGLCLLDT